MDASGSNFEPMFANSVNTPRLKRKNTKREAEIEELYYKYLKYAKEFHTSPRTSGSIHQIFS